MWGTLQRVPASMLRFVCHLLPLKPPHIEQLGDKIGTQGELPGQMPRFLGTLFEHISQKQIKRCIIYAVRLDLSMLVKLIELFAFYL